MASEVVRTLRPLVTPEHRYINFVFIFCFPRIMKIKNLGQCHLKNLQEQDQTSHKGSKHEILFLGKY